MGEWENQNTTIFETWKFGRDGKSIQYCRQSRGSLYELIDHVDVAVECNYLNNDHAESLIEEIKTAIRILNGYINYLKNRKKTNKN